MPTDADDYVYVDTSDYSVDRVDGDTVYVYEGILPDGTTIELTSDTQLSTTYSDKGVLYSYTSDNEIGDPLSEAATVGTVQNTYYIFGRMHVYSDDLLSVEGGSAYYNITADTQVVYVDDDLTEADDNVGYVVLESSNGAATSNVETIYVFRD